MKQTGKDNGRPSRVRAGRLPDDNLREGLSETRALLGGMGIRLPVIARYGKIPKNLVGTGGSIKNIEATGVLTVTIRDDIEIVCARMGIPGDAIPKIIADTGLHEAGHVLMVYVRGEIGLPGLIYSGDPIDISAAYDPWNEQEEERFAEDFVRYCRGSMNTDEADREAATILARCAKAFARDLYVAPGSERTA